MIPENAGVVVTSVSVVTTVVRQDYRDLAIFADFVFTDDPGYLKRSPVASPISGDDANTAALVALGIACALQVSSRPRGSVASSSNVTVSPTSSLGVGGGGGPK